MAWPSPPPARQPPAHPPVPPDPPAAAPAPAPLPPARSPAPCEQHGVAQSCMLKGQRMAACSRTQQQPLGRDQSRQQGQGPALAADSLASLAAHMLLHPACAFRTPPRPPANRLPTHPRRQILLLLCPHPLLCRQLGHLRYAGSTERRRAVCLRSATAAAQLPARLRLACCSTRPVQLAPCLPRLPAGRPPTCPALPAPHLQIRSTREAEVHSRTLASYSVRARASSASYSCCSLASCCGRGGRSGQGSGRCVLGRTRR